MYFKKHSTIGDKFNLVSTKFMYKSKIILYFIGDTQEYFFLNFKNIFHRIILSCNTYLM